MTTKEKKNNKEVLQQAMAVIQSLYENAEPLWRETTITRGQVEKLLAGLNISRASVDKDGIIEQLNASIAGKNGTITELMAETRAYSAENERLTTDLNTAIAKIAQLSKELAELKGTP